MPLRSAALIVALLAVPATAHAQVYRCVHDGRTEFMQTPPKEGQCDPVEAKAPPPSGTDSLKKLSDQIDRNRADEASRRESERQKQAARQRTCSAAKGRKTALDTYGSRIFRTDANGERVYMSEAEYQQQRQQVEDAIREYCD